MIAAYTDGSANPHDGGSGGWAFILVNDQGQVMEKRSGGFRSEKTNNEMELTAVLKCLQFVKPHTKIKIITDSKLVIGWLDQSWKCRYRHLRTLRDQIHDIINTKHLQVRYKHIRGHSKILFNEQADHLAGVARKRAKNARRMGRTIRL